MLERMQTPEWREGAERAFNATPEELGRAALWFARRQAMEHKPRRVVIEHGGRERIVEVENGPFKLWADDQEYYDGWLELEGQDPYGEPYHVTFKKESIKRDVE